MAATQGSCMPHTPAVVLAGRGEVGSRGRIEDEQRACSFWVHSRSRPVPPASPVEERTDAGESCGGAAV